jgi:hypothetical protein
MVSSPPAEDRCPGYSGSLGDLVIAKSKLSEVLDHSVLILRRHIRERMFPLATDGRSRAPVTISEAIGE